MLVYKKISRCDRIVNKMGNATIVAHSMIKNDPYAGLQQKDFKVPKYLCVKGGGDAHLRGVYTRSDIIEVSCHTEMSFNMCSSSQYHHVPVDEPCQLSYVNPESKIFVARVLSDFGNKRWQIFHPSTNRIYYVNHTDNDIPPLYNWRTMKSD